MQQCVMANTVRVAVLGGGPGGLSTAYHLSRHNVGADGHPLPPAQRPLEISVYQLGWRLGGKGASGRNPAIGGRIEEHGIHLFGGFYPNTWNMVIDCYRTLWPDDWREQMAHQFMPCSDQVLTWPSDPTDPQSRWHRVVSLMPSTTEHPWDGGIDEARLFDGDTLATLISKALDQLADFFRRSGSMPEDDPSPDETVASILRESDAELVALRADDGDGIRDDHNDGFFARFRNLRRFVGDDAARETYGHMLEMLRISFKGSISDRLTSRGIDSVDGETFLEWFRRHGMDEETLASPVVLAPANICFQFHDGDTERPCMSATAYLTFLFRSLLSPGAFAYFFRLGTGETVLLPLYDVLRQRGVRFELFTRVVDVIPDGGRVVRVELERQAIPKAGSADYDPRVPIDRNRPPPVPEAPSLGYYTWPTETPYDALIDGDVLRRDGVNLESSFGRPEPVRRDTLLVGQDFDHVVLAVPVPAHPYTCPSLIADRGRDARTGLTWREMVEGLASTPTQACQLWFDESTNDLGLWEESIPPGERFAGPSWVDPLNGWTDFSDLLGEERWGPGGPRGLLYFCGPLAQRAIEIDNPAFADEEWRKVRSQVGELVDGLGGLLTGAEPTVADHLWRRAPGADPWVAQYIRANVQPSERYILAAAGHLAYRRLAWHSGYDNLALAGDWIFTGFNIGSFEGSVMSGALASFALTAAPALDDIVGYEFGRRDQPGHRPRAGEVPMIAEFR